MQDPPIDPELAEAVHQAAFPEAPTTRSSEPIQIGLAPIDGRVVLSFNVPLLELVLEPDKALDIASALRLVANKIKAKRFEEARKAKRKGK